MKTFDWQRDDRDIAFAQAYLNSVKTALKDDQEKYGKFLQILCEFGKNQGSPVQVGVLGMFSVSVCTI